MGNTESTFEGNAPAEGSTTTTATATTTPVEIVASAVAADGSPDFIWPESLYEECVDMADASFLMYTFSYILAVARKEPLQGITLDEKGRLVQPTFTPQEVAHIVSDNITKLSEYFPNEFSTSHHVQEMLLRLQQRATASAKQLSSNPLTLQHFDDQHQQHEMVYAIAKDDVNKRITVAFRGTENELAFSTNWMTNLSFVKTYVDMPPALVGRVGNQNHTAKGVYIHSGFYGYLFEKTFDDSDDPHRRKYEEVLQHVQAVVQENPSYKIYVTGHSLGAALATVTAFFLACEDENLPKPITCLNFASPRVGDVHFRDACQRLEADGKLRICRIVNDKDSLALVPTWYYEHVGFQVRLYKDPQIPIEITYPKIMDDWYNAWGRSFGNSLVTSMNFSNDHGDYRERVSENAEYLKQYDLNELYADKERTGLDNLSK